MQNLKQQQLFDRVFERLPDHVTLLLIIISGFLLARLTWMMFPSDPSLIAPVAAEQETQGVSVIKAHAKSTDLGKEIAGYHLLGVYKPPPPPPPPPKPVVAKAPPPPPKPRPELILVGVYALSGKSSIAVINVKGKQQVIGLNEAIDDSGAILTKVMAESVEVSWDGEIQTLKMPNIGRTALSAIQLPAGQQPQQAEPAVQQPVAIQPASLHTPNQPVNTGTVDAATNPIQGDPSRSIPTQGDPSRSIPTQGDPSRSIPTQGDPSRNIPTIPQSQGNGQQDSVTSSVNITSTAAGKTNLANFRQQIVNNNINLLKVIRPSPKKENGRLIGFRVRPGTNRALFQQTGLKSGDIVTQINGMPLTSNSASMQAMQSLTTSSGATLTVVRGGQTTTVQVAF